MVWSKGIGFLLVAVCCTVQTQHVDRQIRGARPPYLQHLKPMIPRLHYPHRGIRSASNQTKSIRLTSQTLHATSNRNILVTNETKSSHTHAQPAYNVTMPTSRLNMSASRMNMSSSMLNMSASRMNMSSSMLNMPASRMNMSTSMLNMSTSMLNMSASRMNMSASSQTRASSNQTIPFYVDQTTRFTTQNDQPTTMPPHRSGEPYGCRKVSPCICQTQDGARVDLTPLANNNGTPRFLDVPDHVGPNKYFYSWNPCNGFSEGGRCQNVAMCQKEWNPDLRFYDLGGQQSVDFEISSYRGLMVRYSAMGDTDIVVRTAYVQLRCDPRVEANFTAQGEIIPRAGIYYFTLVSRYACLTGGHVTTPFTPVTSPTPTPTPIYNLKTVVDLLFVLTITAVVGLVVLLMVLVVMCVNRTTGKTTAPGRERAGFHNVVYMPEKGHSGLHADWTNTATH